VVAQPMKISGMDRLSKRRIENSRDTRHSRCESLGFANLRPCLCAQT